MKDIDKELIQLLFGDEGIVEADGSGLMDTIRRSQLKQLEKAKALIATQVNQARIDEIAGLRGWTEYEPDPKYSPAERFHIVPYTYLTKRLAELKGKK